MALSVASSLQIGTGGSDQPEIAVKVSETQVFCIQDNATPNHYFLSVSGGTIVQSTPVTTGVPDALGFTGANPGQTQGTSWVLYVSSGGNKLQHISIDTGTPSATYGTASDEILTHVDTETDYSASSIIDIITTGAGSGYVLVGGVDTTSRVDIVDGSGYIQDAIIVSVAWTLSGSTITLGDVADVITWKDYEFNADIPDDFYYDAVWLAHPLSSGSIMWWWYRHEWNDGTSTFEEGIPKYYIGSITDAGSWEKGTYWYPDAPTTVTIDPLFNQNRDKSLHYFTKLGNGIDVVGAMSSDAASQGIDTTLIIKNGTGGSLLESYPTVGAATYVVHFPMGLNKFVSVIGGSGAQRVIEGSVVGKIISYDDTNGVNLGASGSRPYAVFSLQTNNEFLVLYEEGGTSDSYASRIINTTGTSSEDYGITHSTGGLPGSII